MEIKCQHRPMIRLFRGSIRKPTAQIFVNQWACSGSCQTYPLVKTSYQRSPLQNSRLNKNMSEAWSKHGSRFPGLFSAYQLHLFLDISSTILISVLFNSKTEGAKKNTKKKFKNVD